MAGMGWISNWISDQEVPHVSKDLSGVDPKSKKLLAGVEW
jgi:hypothetical protein